MKYYLIRRFYFDESHPNHGKIVKRGLTLDEAQEHCRRDDTHERNGEGNTVWFDGYESELYPLKDAEAAEHFVFLADDETLPASDADIEEWIDDTMDHGDYEHGVRASHDLNTREWLRYALKKRELS